MRSRRKAQAVVFLIICAFLGMLMLTGQACASGNETATGDQADEDYQWRESSILVLVICAIVSAMLLVFVPGEIGFMLPPLIIFVALVGAHLNNIGAFDSDVPEEDIERWPFITIVIMLAAILISVFVMLFLPAPIWLRIAIVVALILGGIGFEYVYTHGII